MPKACCSADGDSGDHAVAILKNGEAYQIGFVDVCDRPYPELCRAARMVGETMYRKRNKGVW